MDRVERPLSPHLQVYRPQITSVLSVFHRGTGLALSAGLLVFVYWLVSLAGGPAAYSNAQYVLGSVWLKLCYVGWAFCFFYHLGNGIRHLAWDLGYGFEASQINLTGWIVVAFSTGATLAFASAVIF
jgi:succinate dehydrogenase cytochrome b subunit